MNEYTDACRRHAQVGAKMKHNNQEIAAWAIRSQMRGVKFTKPVEITYTFYEPNRRRDKSNVAAFGVKVIEDALVMCGVLEDGTTCVAYANASPEDLANIACHLLSEAFMRTVVANIDMVKDALDEYECEEGEAE